MAYSKKNRESQMLMAEAFGLKEEKEGLEDKNKADESGHVVSEDAIDKERKLSEKLQKKIAERMKNIKELSDEGKKYYQKSLLPYFEGVLIFKEGVVPSTKKCFDGACDVIKNASIMERLKLKKTFDIAMYLGPKVVPDLSNMISTGSKYITYAKKNNVKISEETDKILGELK